MGFHLQYIAKHTFLTWDELSCLARCNGFKGDLFEKHCPKLARQQNGLTKTQFDGLFDSGNLDKDLHKTVNFRTSAVNALALRKSMRLVCTKKLSFQEVYDAKVAFDLYDHEADHEGIFLKDLTSVSRALKLSGRIIAPSQLPVEICRLTRSIELPSRLQLHEFLELLTRCPHIREVTAGMDPSASNNMNAQSIYELQDFKSILIPAEKRLENKLNAQKLWKSFKVKYNTARMIKKDVQQRRAKLKAMRFQSSSDHVDELLTLVKESERDYQRAKLGKAVSNSTDRAKERQRRMRDIVKGRPASAPVNRTPSARGGGGTSGRSTARARSTTSTQRSSTRPPSYRPGTARGGIQQQQQQRQGTWRRAVSAHMRCTSARGDRQRNASASSTGRAGSRDGGRMARGGGYRGGGDDDDSDSDDDVFAEEDANGRSGETPVHSERHDGEENQGGTCGDEDSIITAPHDHDHGHNHNHNHGHGQPHHQQRPHGDDWRNSRAMDLTFVQETLREMNISPDDMFVAPEKRSAIVDPHSKVEQEALMEDLKWDLATGSDPALRKLIREAINVRPTAAPARRLSRTASAAGGGSRRASAILSGISMPQQQQQHQQQQHRGLPHKRAWQKQPQQQRGSRGSGYDDSDGNAFDDDDVENGGSVHGGEHATPSKRRVGPTDASKPRVEVTSHDDADDDDDDDRHHLHPSRHRGVRHHTPLRRASSSSIGENALLALREQAVSSSSTIARPTSSTSMLSAWSSASAMSRSSSFADGGRVELQGAPRSPAATLPVRDWKQPGKWKRMPSQA
ncbi:hypothetical protein PTSG_02358 [Salpingoeca rosetta]|uniref:Uncharacterized protein n=1 Tax=Salpingoeca rosetta (strain ATCC 50818 / BSB-021) TaxID=946362 RepID=F2U1Z0_SALR5|nr:uncharacterized protein PTSG_02358 [Salpingoeca rosetta]EGD81642.1 hypothetical protein PTSG_02358 [Salpingoeca rosetta]|eukprot:XP_004996846.1 hypothetical protein PTSG_02358 [Salpingoeca rosetta]